MKIVALAISPDPDEIVMGADMACAYSRSDYAVSCWFTPDARAVRRIEGFGAPFKRLVISGDQACVLDNIGGAACVHAVHTDTQARPVLGLQSPIDVVGTKGGTCFLELAGTVACISDRQPPVRAPFITRAKDIHLTTDNRSFCVHHDDVTPSNPQEIRCGRFDHFAPQKFFQLFRTVGAKDPQAFVADDFFRYFAVLDQGKVRFRARDRRVPEPVPGADGLLPLETVTDDPGMPADAPPILAIVASNLVVTLDTKGQLYWSVGSIEGGRKPWPTPARVDALWQGGGGRFFTRQGDALYMHYQDMLEPRNVRVDAIKNPVSVHATAYETCVITKDRAVHCWDNPSASTPN